MGSFTVTAWGSTQAIEECCFFFIVFHFFLANSSFLDVFLHRSKSGKCLGRRLLFLYCPDLPLGVVGSAKKPKSEGSTKAQQQKSTPRSQKSMLKTKSTAKEFWMRQHRKLVLIWRTDFC